MASDAYLQIDGIKGESTDAGHLGWIEISAGHFGLHQPRSANASTSGGHTSERVNISEIHFNKLVDIASPLLMQTCAMGKTIPKAKIELMRADGHGIPIKYLEITLENVIISDYAPSFCGVGVAIETGSLSFSKLQMKYIQQKIGGGTAGNTFGGWDLAANKVA